MAYCGLEQLNPDLRTIVSTAIDIQFNSKKVKEIRSKDDKFVISFLIALIYHNKKVEALLKKDGITKEKISSFLGFDLDKCTKIRLEESDYKQVELNSDCQPNEFYIFSDDAKREYFGENWAMKYFYKNRFNKSIEFDERANLTKVLLNFYNELPTSFDYSISQIANRTKSFYKTALYSELINNMKRITQDEKVENDRNLLLNYGEFLDERTFLTDPAVDRETEISKLMRGVLNPVSSVMLTGEAGVGKTAIVEGLAYYIQKGLVPNAMKDYKLYQLSTSKIVAGCELVGQFEERLNPLLDLIKDNNNIILVIDEIHSSFGLGAGSTSHLDFINILKPFLDRGDIKVIGMTTNEEYDDIVKKDNAFKSRFKRLNVEEPEQLNNIILNEIDKLVDKTKVKFEFNSDQQDILLNTLIDTTKKTSRVFDDSDNNPRLVLSIINDAFANALLCDRESITAEDFCCAIMDNDRINLSTRKENSDYLRREFVDSTVENKKKKIEYISDRRKVNG